MSALFDRAVNALARQVGPETRVLIIVTASTDDNDDDAPIEIGMHVIDDCEADPHEVAYLLIRASDMALDPQSTQVETSQAIM